MWRIKIGLGKRKLGNAEDLFPSLKTRLINISESGIADPDGSEVENEFIRERLVSWEASQKSMSVDFNKFLKGCRFWH